MPKGFTPMGYKHNGGDYEHDFVLLESIIKHTLNRDVDTDSFGYRKEWLKLTKDLLEGGLYGWIYNQQKSDYLYGVRFKFLVDTILFITTGKRKVSVENWYELLDLEPKADRMAVRANEKALSDLLALVPKYNISKVISQWCSHPKGFYDMICTIEILFGPARTTDVPEEKLTAGLIVKIAD